MKEKRVRNRRTKMRRKTREAYFVVESEGSAVVEVDGELVGESSAEKLGGSSHLKRGNERPKSACVQQDRATQKSKRN
jgi:hypothetical protein